MTGKPDDDELERCFAAARGELGPPPAYLTERVLADAAQVSAARARAGTARAPRRPALAALAELFGGWRGATALAGAAAVGFWVGFASADSLLAEATEDTGTQLEAVDGPVTELFEMAQVVE